MKYERKLTVIKDGVREEICYYVKEKESDIFGCVMYNVGVRTVDRRREIDDFSPDLKEAERLCDYLYERNVTLKNLFDVSEEFIVTM
ncbi:MAG: hypothetical protein IJ316_01790 [Clostridia bacterium]|nr:hypothetical protein [Clostridia bacterium]